MSATFHKKTSSKTENKLWDSVIYGATAAGIVCAIRAAREGSQTLLIHPKLHVGGFMTSGAGGWESPYDGDRTPLLTEVQSRITEYYKETYGEGSQQHLASMPDYTSTRHIDRRKVEPCVIERIFMQMIEETSNLTLWVEGELGKVQSVGSRIESIDILKDDKVVCVRGTSFVDCTYEGDLAAGAGVPYRVGRESREEYGEPHAGKVYAMRSVKDEGQVGWSRDADKGILNMRTFAHCAEELEQPHSTGEGDNSVMAYNYRLILTSDPKNRVLVTKPDNYDPEVVKHLGWGSIVPNLPNNKIAWNCGRIIGPQHGYPDGDKETREAIDKQYRDAILSQLWYIQNDPTAPADAKERLCEMGLPKDEFGDNNHVPYEVYVREGRRIIGRHIFTEHDGVRTPGKKRTPIHYDSMAITDWPLDSVACTTSDHDEKWAEGAIFMSEISRPSHIPYRSMLPLNFNNLLVAVAVSASHVGYGAVRLEPVWMQLAEAAGFAVSMSSQSKAPADVSILQLQYRMAKAGAIFSFFNDVDDHDDAQVAIQLLSTRGFFDSYDSHFNDPLDEATAVEWSAKWKDLSKTAEPLEAGMVRKEAIKIIFENIIADN